MIPLRKSRGTERGLAAGDMMFCRVSYSDQFEATVQVGGRYAWLPPDGTGGWVFAGDRFRIVPAPGDWVWRRVDK